MSRRPNPKTIWLFKLTPLNPDGFSKNLLSRESKALLFGDFYVSIKYVPIV